MRIVTFDGQDERLKRQMAQLLVDAFREHWTAAWSTFDEGMEEVGEMLEAERICRVALDDDGNLLGMIGGIPQYDGHVWELHPLAVQPHAQGRGIGRALSRISKSKCTSAGLCPERVYPLRSASSLGDSSKASYLFIR
jgi:aminoglycoside 6'-N-acetyltransferase I